MRPFAMIGWHELLWILLIVLVLFGAKKLPELAKAMGSSITQFKKGLAEGEQAGEPRLPAPEDRPTVPSSDAKKVD